MSEYKIRQTLGGVIVRGVNLHASFGAKGSYLENIQSARLITAELNTLQAENEAYKSTFSDYMKRMQQKLKTSDVADLPNFIWSVGFEDAGNVSEDMCKPLRKHLDRPYPNQRPGTWKTVYLAEHIEKIESENEALRQRVAELEGELKPALESGDILYRARHINRDVAPDVSMNLAISAGKITKLGDLLGLSKDIPPLYIGNCKYCQEEIYEGDNPLITPEGMYCSEDCTD